MGKLIGGIALMLVGALGTVFSWVAYAWAVHGGMGSAGAFAILALFATALIGVGVFLVGKGAYSMWRPKQPDTPND